MLKTSTNEKYLADDSEDPVKNVTKLGKVKLVPISVSWKHQQTSPFYPKTSTETTPYKNSCVCGRKYANRSGLWKHVRICGNAEHKTVENAQETETETETGHSTQAQKKQPPKNFDCSCGKKYKERTGLWKHQKICNWVEEPTKPLEKINENNAMFVMEIIKQNQDFIHKLVMDQTSKMMEMVKESSHTNITNNNNNTNNFNINMFLNEKCSNAMNIMDFVNSLPLQLDDLDNTANVGYVNGISNIFLRGLNELDIYQRPIHCSDLKRETIYIKDNNVWEKDEDKGKVKKTIQYITQKNLKQLNDWVKENPESKDITTKKHDHYMKILSKCTGGIDDEENEKFFGKIIKNVSKEVYIDKNDK
jgi:hypothetical protein